MSSRRRFTKSSNVTSDRYVTGTAHTWESIVGIAVKGKTLHYITGKFISLDSMTADTHHYSTVVV